MVDTAHQQADAVADAEGSTADGSSTLDLGAEGLDHPDPLLPDE
jgi:hypothetical protein